MPYDLESSETPKKRSRKAHENIDRDRDRGRAARIDIEEDNNEMEYEKINVDDEDDEAPRDGKPKSIDYNAKLNELVILQNADGSWALDNRLAAVFELKVAQLQQTMNQMTQLPAQNKDNIWATILALAYLETILKTIERRLGIDGPKE